MQRFGTKGGCCLCSKTQVVSVSRKSDATDRVFFMPGFSNHSRKCSNYQRAPEVSFVGLDNFQMKGIEMLQSVWARFVKMSRCYLDRSETEIYVLLRMNCFNFSDPVFIFQVWTFRPTTEHEYVYIDYSNFCIIACRFPNITRLILTSKCTSLRCSETKNVIQDGIRWRERLEWREKMCCCLCRDSAALYGGLKVP